MAGRDQPSRGEVDCRRARAPRPGALPGLTAGRSRLGRRDNLTDLAVGVLRFDTAVTEIHDDDSTGRESQFPPLSPSFLAVFTLHTGPIPCEVLTQSSGGSPGALPTTATHRGGDS